MIGILDYKMGNLGSVRNACATLGMEAQLLEQPEQLDQVDALLVPGQGAFRDCMGHLHELGWVDPLRDWVRADKPFFGICMGLQVLFEASEESPGVEGLGLLPGTVTRFADQEGLKVPQMGWNAVRWRGESPVYVPELNERQFYFVHSYHIPLTDAEWAAGITDFGGEYVSAVSFGRCHAVQFHPEKSQSDGLALLKAFADSLES